MYDRRDILPEEYANRVEQPAPPRIFNRHAKGEERKLTAWPRKSQTPPRSPAKR